MASMAKGKDIENIAMSNTEDDHRDMAEGKNKYVEEEMSTHAEYHNRKLSKGKGKEAIGDNSERIAEDGKGNVTKGKGKQVEDLSMNVLEGGTGGGPTMPKKPLSEQAMAKYKAWGKTLVAEGKKVEKSLLSGVVTVAEQAAKEPDFLGGDVGYYDLTYASARKHVDGEYIIVWGRNRGVLEEGQKEVETYDVSMEHSLEVFTKKRQYEENKYLTKVFADGNFAAANLRAADKSLSMVMMEHEDGRMVAGVDVQRRDPGQNPSTSFLQTVVQSRISHKGSMVVFGIKVVGQARNMSDAGYFTTVTLGFEFAKLILGHANPLTKKIETMDVVAIKIPEDGNVGSAFILKQKLFDLPNPDWIVYPSDESEEEEEPDEDTEMLL